MEEQSPRVGSTTHDLHLCRVMCHYGVQKYEISHEGSDSAIRSEVKMMMMIITVDGHGVPTENKI